MDEPRRPWPTTTPMIDPWEGNPLFPAEWKYRRELDQHHHEEHSFGGAGRPADAGRGACRGAAVLGQQQPRLGAGGRHRALADRDREADSGILASSTADLLLLALLNRAIPGRVKR